MKILLTILSLVLPTLALAEVSYDSETSTLRITGPTDVAQVVYASNYMAENDVKYVEMWGPGGYLEMGLQLGNRISRIKGVTVVVPKGKRCISACAFAAMGAKHIRVDGKLMLHRPFITHAPTMINLEETLSYMGKGYLKAAYYLEDHGYSRHVMNNIMDYTSPCKFMVYEDLEVKERKKFLGWRLDDSRCEMMSRRIQR